MWSVVARRKNGDVKYLINKANGNVALLAIIFPGILSNESGVPFKAINEFEREAPFGDVA